ncbi:hypothetical protein FJZ36_06915 [Candidatus Poribacteria bacterium]|nr:hypothetical protein [Candidatus Poribacteria bacterium]
MDARDRTVILLGAGASSASAHCLPVMKGFFQEACGIKPTPELKTGLEWLYGRETQPEDMNLEEVIAFLDMSEQHREGATFKELDATDHLVRLRRELDRFLRRRLTVESPWHSLDPHSVGYGQTPRKFGDSLHSALFDAHLRRDNDTFRINTLVTLNYDLVADYALRCLETWRSWRRSGGVLPSRMELQAILRGTRRSPEHWDANTTPPGWYLKLHGSLDWVSCLNPACPHGRRCFSVEFDRQPGHDDWYGVGVLPADYNQSLPCVCGHAYRLVIVPPTYAKRYEGMPMIEREWRLAVQQLQGAKRVIVVGVSFAPSDVRLAWLVRYGLLGASADGIQIDLVYRCQDNADPMEHDVYARARALVPHATIRPFPNGLRAYLESEGLLEQWNKRSADA